jgi:hypothetical protein
LKGERPQKVRDVANGPDGFAIDRLARRAIAIESAQVSLSSRSGTIPSSLEKERGIRSDWSPLQVLGTNQLQGAFGVLVASIRRPRVRHGNEAASPYPAFNGEASV